MAKKSGAAVGCLYVVATPLGNLGDFSARGREVLASVDCIAAEDTRHSGKLLAHHGISRPMLAYHDHGAARVRGRLLRMLRDGARLALICDAGTPLISDPGHDLVKAAREQGIEVLPVPGPCALIAALSVAGLPTDRFVFAGFPPATAAARKRWLGKMRDEPATWILYESAHRITACVDDLAEALGAERRVFLAREMTKQFEAHFSGALEGAAHWLRHDENQRKGEFVLVVAGCKTSCAADENLPEALRVMALLKDELPPGKAAAIAQEITGVRKNLIYRAAVGQR